ncbi:MAG: NAD(P)-binding protein [Gammaproteobacteria bacterium]|nr:NAD(P)-binding protein [Gammaproteobacteria bacterium]
MNASDFDLLFEPIDIGPVTAKNRFYQVPHCTGLGYAHPQAEAALRKTKAAGGWGVVCTQEVEIHPSSEISPAKEGRLWDDRDIPAHQLMTDGVHEYGALAGIELVHNGQHAPNLSSRTPPMGPSHRPVDSFHPVQARAMDAKDIANFKQWHVDAAKRAMHAGYDIVYVYAGHDMATLMHFLLSRYNDRTDNYGGSLVNRVRLLEETLRVVKDAVGDRCAVALRLAVDEIMGSAGLQSSDEGAEIVSRLADIPDLWDVNISGWENDSATARFEPNEGYQEPYTAFVKQLVNTPVVGVGRFTSPDAMVSQIKRGVLDFIGAARPSIADPYLPYKIKAGATSEIRECIGCNICVASDNVIAPIRCTQNPTMGEEWKRRWHPEFSPTAKSPKQTLVVGAGPAGLECALQLSRQGHMVMLADSRSDTGGRLLDEAVLPGLSSYRRVRDYRHQQLLVSPQVDLLLNNTLAVKDIAETGIKHVFVATGSRWSRNARGRQHPEGVALGAGLPVYTPDDLYAENYPEGRVLLYDDDHYYLGSVLAEALKQRGCDVLLVTPAAKVSVWTEHTLEQHRIQARLLRMGVKLITSYQLHSVSQTQVKIQCIYSERIQQFQPDALLVITSRLPERSLYDALNTYSCFDTLELIGDSAAPSTVAAAVYSGHLAARSLNAEQESNLFRREQPELQLTP